MADTAKRDEMTERSGGRTTVPQIFIDGRHVGGSDELYALDRAGKLDAMLGLGS
jgi:glutaredoxin 3